MKRFGSIRNAAAVVVLGGLVAAVVAVASAQAAPSKKNYTVQVAVTNDAVSHQGFTVTVKNDSSSNTTLGSANVTLPTTFTAGTATTLQAGWTATIATDSNGTSTVQLRSATSGDALTPGESMTVSVYVSTPALPTTCADASWSSTAKQSNDYNGTNNWFTLLTGQSDMKPLGSFEIKDIGTQIGTVFAPAIYTNQQYTSTTTAYDSCHNVKTTYSGATLTHHGLTNASYVPSGGQTLTWSSGVGTVKITPSSISETANTITVTDGATGITDTSKPFDTQDKICTSTDTTCTWHNGNNSINASAPPPAAGSLGVGFNGAVTFSGDCTGDALGQTMITIAPHGVPAGPYLVTIVYSKQVSGTGPANSFNVCESTDNGGSFHQLPLCVDSGTGFDCVFDRARITGGALQVILSLLPGDPYVGGK